MDVATTTVGVTDLKFRLVREDFADAVAWVARNLPSRPTVPVLAGVLITGSEEGLTPNEVFGAARRAGAIRPDIESSDVMHALAGIYGAPMTPDWRERSSTG